MSTWGSSIRVSWGVLLLGIVSAVLLFADLPGGAHQTIRWTSIAISLGLAIVQVARGNPWAKPTWLVIIGILVLFTTGLAVRAFLEPGVTTLMKTSVGTIDIMYALAYLMAVGALSAMLYRARRRSEPLSFIDASTALLATWALGAEFILVPLFRLNGLTPGFLLQVLFLTVNASLVWLAARMWLTTTRVHNTALRMILLTVIIFVVNDVVSSAINLLGMRGDWLWTSIYEAGTVLCLALCAAAASHPTVSNAPNGVPHAGRLSAGRSVVAATIVMSLLALMGVRQVHNPEAVHLAMGALWLLGFGLLAARSVLLVTAYRESVSRESILRQATNAVDADPATPIDPWISAICSAATSVTDRAIPASDATVEPLIEYADGIAHRYTTSAPCGHGRRRQVVVEASTPLDPSEWEAVQALVATFAEAQFQKSLEAERKAAEEGARVAALLTEASDMVILLDRRSLIQLAGGAAEELTGRPGHEWHGRHIRELFPAGSPVMRALAAMAPGQRTRIDATTAIKGSGASPQVEVTINRLSSGETAVSLHDITERQRLTSELAHQARHDALTGLPNRVALHEALDEAERAWAEHGTPFSLVYIDLDDFKVVNDSLGHHYGDMLLTGVAERLRAPGDTTSIVARLGGDEFAILLPGSDLDAALERASEVVAEIRKPMTVSNVELTVRASAGVAASSPELPTGSDVIEGADLALFDSKALGKGFVSGFRPVLKQNAMRNLTAANAVTVAARRGEFVFHYQPIWELDTMRVAGVEALMRWPRGGELRGPDKFIPIAESIGELTHMMRGAVEPALADLAGWRRINPDLRLTFNVHPGALLEDDFERWLSRCLADNGLSAEAVAIELTEQALVPTQALRQLRTLFDRGVGIYIDDFGTGWSNLGYLNTLPVTGLKLARETIIGEHTEVKSDIVESIVRLASANGIKRIIAEGVETEQQRRELQRHGIGFGQGYLVSPAVTADEVPSAVLGSSRLVSADA